MYYAWYSYRYGFRLYPYKVLLPLLLLLAAAVRHRVPDDTMAAGSLNLIPVFVSSQHDLFSVLPLGSTVAFTASICLDYILGNDGHARSQGGRQPVASKPPLEPSILSRVVAALLPYQ